jgi:hypothetical protein
MTQREEDGEQLVPDEPTEGQGDEEKAAPPEPEPEPTPRIRPVDPDHFDRFRWLKGVLGEALAVILRGEPVGEDRMDVGPAGTFLVHLDTLTRLLASHFAGEEPKPTGTIKRPQSVGRLQFAAAQATNSITLYFALDKPTQLKLEGGDDLWESPMGKAVREVVSLIEMSDDVDDLIQRSHQLGDRIADRYHDMLEFLVLEQLEAEWQPRDRPGTVLTTHGAAEVKAALDREIAEEVETQSLKGTLYEANSRTHGFEFEAVGVGRIQGDYPDELTEYIRFAWNREVEARIRIIQHRRARSTSPFKVEYHLLDVALPDDTGPQLLGPDTEA